MFGGWGVGESVVVICTQTSQRRSVVGRVFLCAHWLIVCVLGHHSLSPFTREHLQSARVRDYLTASHRWLGLEHQQLTCHKEDTFKHV